METLGHSPVSLTLDTYSHVLPSLQEQAAKSIDAAIGCETSADDQSNSEADENSLERVSKPRRDYFIGTRALNSSNQFVTTWI